MRDVLFGQAYSLRFDPKLYSAMQPYPPLATLYAAAVVREAGYSVAFFDAMLARSAAEWEHALDRARPRFAVLYEDNFNYLTKMCLLRMRQAAFEMIEAARRRGCTVIVAGSDATDQAGRYLAAGAHVVLTGEGDETLVEVLAELSGRTQRGLESVRGIVFPGNGGGVPPVLPGAATRGEHGGVEPVLPGAASPDGNGVVRTPARPVLRDLDALPMPAWDLIDMDRYRTLWKQKHGYFSLNMVTSRGCPFHCNWCAKPIWGQRYHARSPESVVAEMSMLKQRYEPDNIWFMDDILGIKPGWIARMAELVEEHDVRIPFKCLSRADLLLRPGEVPALAKAGCRIAWIGAESGSQRILDAMEKGTTVGQIREAAQRLHDSGIEVGFFLQFGYPGEGREDIEKTFELVRDCWPDQIGVSVSYPLPGTRFYQSIREQLGDRQNWVDSEDLAMLYRGPFATPFYRKLHTVLHKEFRARQAGRRLRGALRLPHRLGRQDVREAAAFAFHTATLPLARLQLGRLAHLPHEGMAAAPPSMSPAEAATPSNVGGGES